MSVPRLHEKSTADREIAPVRQASCFPRVAAAILLLASLGLGAWNVWAHTPWAETATRPASAAEPRLPHTAVNRYSVNTFLSTEVEPWKREKTMEMISLAGIGWIKEGFPWSEIEPAEGSFWDPEFQQDSWQKYDEIVDLAEQYGVRIIARLDHTPVWARDDETDYNSPPTDIADFGRFVEAFVERYRGRIQYIQIWNEPNLSREWGGNIDPDGYFELLREAYTRAKDTDPSVVVLSAPMAMTNERSDRAIPEFEYWEALYERGVGDYFDVMTATGYGIDQPPEEPPGADVINLRRIERLRDIQSDYGDAAKPIWLTEYGWNASPDSIPEEMREWGAVTDQQQAEWTVRGVNWMDQNWDWYGVSSIWYFRQVGFIPPDAAEYYFAMVDLEFTPRQVYLAVKDDALERQVALPGTYGPLESPIQGSGRWSRIDDPGSEFGESIISSQTGAEIQIDFSGTDLTLTTSDLEPLSGRLYVKLNDEPIDKDLYTVDSEGRTYLDLDSVDVAGSEIQVVSGYGTSQPQRTNTFVLHVDQGATFSLASVTVGYQRSYTTFAIYAAVSLIGLAASGMLFRR